MTEPVEWANYDQSSLPNLLRHDTWNRYCGLPLLSGIDPRKSEVFEPLVYYNVPYDEVYEFERQNSGVRDNGYWKIQLLADPPNSAKRTWYENVDSYEAAVHDWHMTRDLWPELASEDSLDAILKKHFLAKSVLDELIDLFNSNPVHDSEYTARPAYFINWAKAKHLDIPWLAWARSRNLIDEEQARADESVGLDKRERDTLDALVGALLHSLEIDPGKHGVIKQIEGITEDYGAPIRKTAIGNILKNPSCYRVCPRSKKPLKN